MLTSKIINKLTFVLLLGITFSLIGCANKNKDQYADWTAQDLYEKAAKMVKRDQNTEAIKIYEALDSHYPFGAYTEQAHLDVIFAYYEESEMAAAMNAADRFIQMHPRSPNLDYAYYMRGLIKFHENIGFLESKLLLDPSYRQTTTDRESFGYFSQLVNRFPESPYSTDARQRMIYLRNHLAKSELNTAYWYIRRKAYLAAANRARYVVEHFEHSTAVPDALAVMAYCYNKLSLPVLADNAELILHTNFPENRALEKLNHYNDFHLFGFL
jgi:outer membrane protein assembly factor BamD